MSDEAFDSYAREFFNQAMERHPIAATYRGVHEYDHLLGDDSRSFREEEIELTKEARRRFDSFDPEELSGGRPLDRELALHLADLRLFELKEMRFWESIPQGAENLGSALFPLFTREFAPLPKRVESITGRLGEARRYLEGIRSRIRLPVKLWTEMALDAVARTPAFIELIVQSVEGDVPKDAHRELKAAAKEAVDALKEYESWLREEVLPGASGPHILGAERFDNLVERRGLDYPVPEIHELGVRILRESKEELTRVAKSIDPKASLEEVKERVKSNHPKDFDGVLKAVREAVQEARRFVVEKRLATLPPAEKLHVMETPTFLRPVLPFAAYFPPARFDKVQEGVYIVTPPSDGEELLKEHNYPSIRNTVVHEGYPGHHLQLSAANLNPSLVRALSVGAAETVEGWAHYCEDLMRETGFNVGPEIRFVQLLDVIWRACRIIIDVDLHSGRMGFEEAVEMLVREAGMERPSAIAEVKRYTQHPAYQLSYLLGKQLIKDLRKEVEEKMGDRFSLGFFHDTILYTGSIPFYLLRRAMEDKVAKLEERVEDLY